MILGRRIYKKMQTFTSASSYLLASHPPYQTPENYLPNIFFSIVLKTKYDVAANAAPSSNPTSPPNGASPAVNAIGPVNHT